MAVPDFASADEDTRRRLARALVAVCDAAVDLSEHRAGGGPPSPPMARSLGAAEEYGGKAVESVAGITQRTLAAVSFPRFVEELLNGVFKAMIGANVQQMESFVDLLDSVAASSAAFAERAMGDDAARQWLVDTFPGVYEVVGDEDAAPADRGWATDDEPVTRGVRVRPGSSAPGAEAVRGALGLAEGAVVTPDTPERLLPLVRQAVAGKRQNVLASLVMMGLNRIVVESGSVDASMRFHIDARSAAEADKGSTLDGRHTSSGGGSFGIGAWGASASMTNTIGFVRTEQTLTTEDVNVGLDLNSSVRINFKSDYVPVAHLAGVRQVDAIRSNSRNPESPVSTSTLTPDRSKSDTARREAVSRRLEPRAPELGPNPSAEKELERATQARKEAAGQENRQGTSARRDEKPPAPTAEKSKQPPPTDNGPQGNSKVPAATNPPPKSQPPPSAAKKP